MGFVPRVQGGNPWTQNQQIQSQDDIEGAFVVKQILHQQLHGIDFDKLLLKRKTMSTCHMTLKISHMLVNLAVQIAMLHSKMTLSILCDVCKAVKLNM